MMAMHPDIQERVVNEMRSVFSSVDQEVTIDLISKLDYLHMVLSETLRLFPITPLIGREIQQTVKLQQFEVPTGAAIMIPIYKVHRNVAIWGQESHLFNPDNFLPEKIESRHPYRYVYFVIINNSMQFNLNNKKFLTAIYHFLMDPETALV